MSQQLISRSPDLAKLREDGYEIDIRHNHLIISSVPYVNGKKEVRLGKLISELSYAGDVTVRPGTHVIMFAGDYPCDMHGQQLDKIVNETQRRTIADGLVIDFSFSSKPRSDGYNDYYEKITTYVAILSSQAEAIEPTATARTGRVIENTGSESVFNYLDTASSRAGIVAATQKVAQGKVAIIGAGGTGAYVLDLVAKTPVPEIHVFDGDRFLQHNAFRCPGAPSLEELRELPSKVAYLTRAYSRMRKHIVAHEHYIDSSNIESLRGMSFVFICIDDGATKKVIVEKLEEWGISFVDVGMGLELVDDRLIGIVRVTTSTKSKRDHVRSRISFAEGGRDNVYSKNIQIAELNALNAALAVVKWKKLCGFYVDLEHEHFCTYTVDGNALANEDKV